MTTLEILKAAKAACPVLAGLSEIEKNQALASMADALEGETEEILKANALDVEAAQGKISPVMIDRLALSESRIAGMASGIREVADLPDPAGKVLKRIEKENGLIIE